MTRTMIARVTPRPGQEARLRTLVEELAAQVRAEAGNIRFEAFAEEGGARGAPGGRSVMARRDTGRRLHRPRVWFRHVPDPSHPIIGSVVVW